MALYLEALDEHIEGMSGIIDQYVTQTRSESSYDIGESSLADSELIKDDTPTDKKTTFYGDIQNKTKDIYRALNFSAISGEYVDRSDFESKIVGFISKIGEVIALLSDKGKEEESEVLYNVANCIIRDLKLYKLQVHLFYKSVDNPKLQFIDYDIINEDNAKIKDRNIQIELFSKIYRANLNLVFIDREFTLHERCFFVLNSICHDLKEYKSRLKEEYIDILIHKCQILIAKFRYKEDIGNLRLSYNYYNDKDEGVQLIVDNSIIFSKLQKIYTKDKNEYRYTISELYDVCPSKCLTFMDFFVKCHYFKNIAENESLLRDLIKEFELFQKNIQSSFDRKNALSCLNYLNNCRLSFILKQENTDPVDVVAECFKIRSVQDVTSVKNYFPFLKIAEWYSNYLSKHAENISMSNDLMQVVNSFEKNLEIAEEYLASSRHNAGCFIPFKPNLQECLEAYKLADDGFVNIFLSSSFIVPVDYDKEEKRIEKLHSNLIKFKAIVEAHRSVNSIITKLKKSNEMLEREIDSLKIKSVTDAERINSQVQSDLKDNQKGSIQILAIFAGIVIFASGTIQIFKGASNIKDATIFMLLFASALSIISLSIWFISASKNGWDRTKTFLVIILVLIFGLNVFAIWGDWGQTIIHLLPE